MKKGENKVGTGVIIVSCNCEHEFQDRKYGRKKRVHNMGKGKGGNLMRCTVCGSEKG